MATNYPSSLDSLTNPTTNDPVNNPSHAVQHANANDAIEALQTKVGTNNSAVSTSLDYRIKQLELNPGVTQSYVDTAISNLSNTSSTTYVPQSDVGQIDGVASLDSTGKIPDTQIPAGIARDSEVSTAIANLVNSAPSTLDTLNELATALGNDANFSTTITTTLGNKLDSTTAASTYLTQANASSTYAPIASPTFTGTVGGITKSMVGLDNVDNTSDANKPVSTNTQTALNLKAPLASPALTGTPTAPTAAAGTDSTQIATTAFVQDSIDASVQPGALYQTTAPLNPEVGQIWVDSDDNIEAFDLTNKKTEIAASISANTNLVAGRRYFVTSGSALTLTLPASPALNDEIQILDASGNASTYNITVARNGKLINGTAGNLIIDNNGGWYSLLYTGNTYGWKVG